MCNSLEHQHLLNMGCSHRVPKIGSLLYIAELVRGKLHVVLKGKQKEPHQNSHLQVLCPLSSRVCFEFVVNLTCKHCSPAPVASGEVQRTCSCVKLVTNVK